jgi:hypothetical protein
MSPFPCAVSTRAFRARLFFTVSELFMNRNRAEGPLCEGRRRRSTNIMYDLKLSRRIIVLKFFQAISRVSVELKTNVSGISSVSNIRVDDIYTS